jgi:hypothetical protein
VSTATAVRDYAALAGDADALNEMLKNAGQEKSLLFPEEKAELEAKIEGLPPEGEARESWILKNAGGFTWDEAAGKYRATPRTK